MGTRKVLIEFNPYRAIALLLQDGIVVGATADGYVGMSESEAVCAAASVMRYKLSEKESGADGYSQKLVLTLPSFMREEPE